jgi:hypothetical protein
MLISSDSLMMLSLSLSLILFVSQSQVPAEAQNICGNNLVLPETLRVGITDDSFLCIDSGRVGIPEASEDISAEVPNAQTETKPEVRMSGRTRRKSQMHCKTKHMSCNEGSDNLQVVYATFYQYCKLRYALLLDFYPNC